MFNAKNTTNLQLYEILQKYIVFEIIYTYSKKQNNTLVMEKTEHQLLQIIKTVC